MHQNNTPELQARLLKAVIAQGKIKRRLYKYTTIESAVKILERSSLIFRQPKEFNDPFDCNIEAAADNTSEEIERYYRDILKESPERADEIGNINAAIRRISKNPERFREQLTSATTDKVMNKGICCFSRAKGNILMWSHYANFHKGVCICFKIENDLDFFANEAILNIHYDKNYPHYNHIRERKITEPFEMVRKLFGTKYIHWKYEKEVRVIKQTAGYYNFKKECLNKIFFGMRASDNDIFRVMKVAKDGEYSTTFSKARPQRGAYGLDFDSPPF